jgi:ribonucleotide reductase beta subunit family protein with ferritin-like domain
MSDIEKMHAELAKQIARELMDEQTKLFQDEMKKMQDEMNKIKEELSKKVEDAMSAKDNGIKDNVSDIGGEKGK